jgi:hypothetical protein
VLIKQSSTSGQGWQILDTMRGIFTGFEDPRLIANSDIAAFASDSLLLFLIAFFNSLSSGFGKPGNKTCTPVVGANIGGIGGNGEKVEFIQ